MDRKQKQRLGGAIATTILSCVSLSPAVFDKAQAAVLTYNFTTLEYNGASGFFKFDNSSLAGIGVEEIAVSEGTLNTSITASFSNPYERDYDLVGATVLFFQGKFRGLRARGSDYATREINFPGDELVGPYYMRYGRIATWSLDTNGAANPDDNRWIALFSGYSDTYVTYDTGTQLRSGGISIASRVSYTLVNTAVEPVPEPITFAGTALAAAALSWLKSKKKNDCLTGDLRK